MKYLITVESQLSEHIVTKGHGPGHK